MSEVSMDPTLLWAIIVLMALLLYSFRASFILLVDRIDDVPTWFERALRFVPPAVFAAFVLPVMVAPEGTLAVSLGNEQLIAGTIAAIVAWRTGNLLLTIIAGMSAFGLLQVL